MTLTADNETTPVEDVHNWHDLPVVASHYQVDLQRPVGAGGMAVVYLGRDIRNNQIVALKTLRLEYRNDQASRARFRREIRTMAFVRHPNVPEVFELWEDDQTAWAVLEFVPGRSLREAMHDEWPLTIDTIVAIVDQVASVLTFLHSQKLVHLDLKPQNLMLTHQGTLKLVDFGLTQQTGRAQDLVGGMTFGTAAYLAPEQACGDPISPATDVYSLACVVYEMLTGRPPFIENEGEQSGELIQAHLHLLPEPPSRLAPHRGLPAAVDDVLGWALSKQPSFRFASASSFADALYVAVNGHDRNREQSLPISYLPEAAAEAQSAPATSARRRPFRRTARFLWRACAVLLALNLLLAAGMYLRDGELPGSPFESAQLAQGQAARVSTASLNLRANPELASATIAVLLFGDVMEISGDAVSGDAETWWPVTLTLDGEHVQGYVWDGGVELAEDSVLDRLSDRFNELRERVF